MQAHVLLIALGQGAADLDHRGEERRELFGGVVEVRADPDPGARAVVDDEASLQQRVVDLLGTARVAQVEASKEAGADAIEINTGPYADAPDAGSEHPLVAG